MEKKKKSDKEGKKLVFGDLTRPQFNLTLEALENMKKIMPYSRRPDFIALDNAYYDDRLGTTPTARVAICILGALLEEAEIRGGDYLDIVHEWIHLYTSMKGNI